PGALPPWLGHAVCRDGPAGAGPRRAGCCQRAVPCHGDDLLATPDRGGPGAGGGTAMTFYQHADHLAFALRLCFPLLHRSPYMVPRERVATRYELCQRRFLGWIPTWSAQGSGQWAAQRMQHAPAAEEQL